MIRKLLEYVTVDRGAGALSAIGEGAFSVGTVLEMQAGKGIVNSIQARTILNPEEYVHHSISPDLVLWEIAYILEKQDEQNAT